MAKQQKLTAQPRIKTGRSAVNEIKKQGLVPAVVYGGKDKQINLSINAREIGNILSHATSEHFLVDLEIADGGSKTNRLALVQEVQHDPIRGSVLHVDFHAVKADEKLHAQIPVVTVGEPSGVKNYGGILEISMHSLEVECFPKDLPEVLTIDVSALNVGEGIHVKDIKFPEGVTTRVDGDLTVVRVAAPAVEIEPAPAAEAAAGPEVIKEKKEEGAAAAGAAPAKGSAPAKGAAPAKPADKK
jgi:large subunit ribosomal protein L25